MHPERRTKWWIGVVRPGIRRSIVEKDTWRRAVRPQEKPDVPRGSIWIPEKKQFEVEWRAAKKPSAVERNQSRKPDARRRNNGASRRCLTKEAYYGEECIGIGGRLRNDGNDGVGRLPINDRKDGRPKRQ